MHIPKTHGFFHFQCENSISTIATISFIIDTILKVLLAHGNLIGLIVQLETR